MTPEDRLSEGLKKWDEKVTQKLILGCMMHFSVLVIILGFGYYLGWGLTFIMFGGYCLLFTMTKVYTYYTKEKDSNDTAIES